MLISTGGTGGHVIPAKIIAEHLEDIFDIYYSTDLRGLKYLLTNKKKTIICDDYMDASYITEVKKAVDDFVKKNDLKFQVIKGKFVSIET